MSSIDFKGKAAVWNHHLSVPYHALKKDAKLSHKGSGEDDNLIVQGDNLLALKSLLPKYAGKVKCVYIDPPYNTGTEGWIYNDSVSSPLISEWLGKVVDKEDLTKHDKWLSMMTPRLKLLRELLAEDGVIFASIDDNEVHHLKSLFDEIFGQKNFVEQIVVQTNPRGSQASIHFANTHEYVLVYAKQIEGLEINGEEKDEEDSGDYPYSETDGKKYRLLGLRQRGGAWRREDRPTMFYPFWVNPADGSVSLTKTKTHTVECLPKRPSGEEGRWGWSPKKASSDGHLLVGRKVNRADSDGDFWDIFRKDYLEDEEGNEKQSKIKSLWIERTINYQAGRAALKELFEGKDVFDYPKPVELIKRALVAGTDKDSIVLDAFAGSGTTAQAVMELNECDGGNRKFILVQLNEEIKKDTTPFKAGFRFIHEITRERVARFIDANGIDTGFGYFTLGPAIDADSILGGALPDYADFAKYVFYLATGKDLADEKKIDPKKYFVGKDDSTSVFLCYEPDLETLKKVAVTLDWAEAADKAHPGRKIVYAPACYLDDESAKRLGIEFVGIPYNLFERQK